MSIEVRKNKRDYRKSGYWDNRRPKTVREFAKGLLPPESKGGKGINRCLKRRCARGNKSWRQRIR